MPITPLPPAPSRAEPATFSAKGDALLGALAGFVTQANALEVVCNADEVQTNADVVSCAASVIATANSEAVALASSNFKGTWSGLAGAAVVPYAVTHLGKYWQLASNLADVSAKTPGTDPEWVAIDRYCLLIAKTADVTLSVVELLGNVLITNTGAGGPINLTLQPGAANYSIEFEVTAGQYLKVTCAGTDPIGYEATTVTGAAIYVRSNVIGTKWRMTWNGLRYTIDNLRGILSYNQ